MKNRLLAKLLTLLAMSVLLMFALAMIQDVVEDRIRNQRNAVQSVVASLAGPQTLMGPAIVQGCTETTSVANGRKTEYSTREFQRIVLPDDLNHQAATRMEARSRSLHQVNTFVLKDRVTASFGSLEPPKPLLPTGTVRCNAPQLAFALSDSRGIRSVRIMAGQQALQAQPGSTLAQFPQGFHATLAPEPSGRQEALQVSLELELVGTQSLAFVPLGQENTVRLDADWPHPSFGGSFLPTRREIGDDGFQAHWSLSALASSARQDFLGDKARCPANVACSGLETLGVDFVEPVNPYTLSDRATKYGLLFIVLTFVAVGLFEVLKSLRVHPMQYLLVGAALCSFFLLLLSFSEHLEFSQAYAIAAAACTALLAYYASHILGSLRRGLPFASGIACLFGLLYVLLRLESTALIVGSVALFAVLTLVMVLTRRVDWYAFGKYAPDEATQPAARQEVAA